MIKKLTYGMAAASFAALLSTTSANALIIDDFTDHLENTVVGSDGLVQDLTPNGIGVFDRSVQIVGNILGGDRELVLNNTNPEDAGVVTAQVTPLPPAQGDVFRHNNSGGTGTSLLRWDGTDGDTDGLDFNLGGAGAGVDLAQGGLNQFIHISVLQADLTGSTVTLTLYTDGVNNFSSASVALPAGPSEHFLSLAAIAGISSGALGGVDLTDVRAIELFAVGSASFDVAIDIIEVVPEPASLTLLGAGIMGLGYFGRRRKAA